MSEERAMPVRKLPLLKIANVVALLVLIGYAVFYFSEDRLSKKSEQLNVLIFDTKVMLSSEYYLLAPEGNEEIQLPGGNDSQILVGGKVKEEFLTYLLKETKNRENKCGLNIISGGKDVTWTLVYSDINYLFFAGADSSLAAEPAIKEICANVKNGIVWHPKKAHGTKK